MAEDSSGDSGPTPRAQQMTQRAEELIEQSRTAGYAEGQAIEADLVRIGEPAVGPLLRAVEDADARVRGHATTALGDIGDPRAVEPLIELLGDADVDRRWDAALALGKLGDGRAVAPLIAALGDPHRYIRGMAARALAQIGDRHAVEPILTLLEDGDYSVQVFAVAALGALGDPRAVAPLLQRLDQPGPLGLLLRRPVVEALGKLGDARAIEPLTALRGNEDLVLRQLVEEALARLQASDTAGK